MFIARVAQSSFLKRLLLITTAGLTLSAAVCAQSVTYSYDDLGRLTSASFASSMATSYQYDAADNRTSVATSSIASPPPGSITIYVTSAANLRTLANNAGYTGSSTANYQFIVQSGTTVTGASGGGTAIDTGTWPSGVTLSLIVSGNVYGGGGNGGNGNWPGTANSGASGGTAVNAQAPISVTINSGGAIEGGGGGGGGGGTVYISTPGGPGGTSGSGGGGGFPNGIGGSHVSSGAVSGTDGTISGGGAGGAGSAPTGGNGGNAGASGSAGTTSGYTNGTGGSGGGGGYAIHKNGNAVTLSGGGSIIGTVS